MAASPSVTHAVGLTVVCTSLLVACVDEKLDPAPNRPSYTPPDEFRVPGEVDLTRHVDPFIGTSGAGNAIPGALLPHGMVRLSPDSVVEPGSIDAYEHDSDRIEGFTHLHLEGPGGSANGYNQIRVMPAMGSFDLADLSAAFSHDDEEAAPGYYAVTLDSGVRVELTATAHAGVHRYTFPAGEASLVLDLGSSNGLSRGGSVEIVGDRALRGVGQYIVHPLVSSLLTDLVGSTGESEVYFYTEVSRPFTRFGTWQQAKPPVASPSSREASGVGIGAWVGFDSSDGEAVELRIGISMIGTAEARNNLEAEVGATSFADLRAAADDAWNAKLNRIQIEGSDDITTTFYTALYHSMFQPANYTEASGRFAVSSSGERRVLDGGGRPFYTDDWCMWDTYRTSHPLGTVTEPEIRGDIVRSLLTIYEQGGWLPKCTWNATGYSRVMTGNHGIAIIADAWTKGLDDFDQALAWQAMSKTSTQQSDGVLDGTCGYFDLGTPPEYLEQGYVGFECDPSQAASMTLELAFDDACMAAVAGSRGDQDALDAYSSRAQSFRNHFDPTTGFMRPRTRDGSWLEPFDPASTESFNGFVEASAWIFTFFVPHDVPALIELIGGNEAFVARLDQFFADGHFDPSNQPSFHIPWLYNYAGAPHKTQERVRQIFKSAFHTGPGGLPGNDDAGSTSAWYVLAALGLYPVAPGSGVLQLSTPLVERAVIHLHPAFYDGGAFVIEVEDQAPDNDYIQSASLDGAPLGRTYITHEELVRGGVLRFVLGPEPSSWASGG